MQNITKFILFLTTGLNILLIFPGSSMSLDREPVPLNHPNFTLELDAKQKDLERSLWYTKPKKPNSIKKKTFILAQSISDSINHANNDTYELKKEITANKELWLRFIKDRTALFAILSLKNKKIGDVIITEILTDLAQSAKDLELIRALLQRGASAIMPENRALQRAIDNDDAVVLEIFINNGAGVNSTLEYSNQETNSDPIMHEKYDTPLLHYAVHKNKLSVVKMLLEYNAHSLVKDRVEKKKPGELYSEYTHNTALDYAQRNDNDSIKQLLIAAQERDLKRNLSQELLKAVQKNKIEDVEFFLNFRSSFNIKPHMRVDIETQDDQGNTALLLAAQAHNRKIAITLARANANAFHQNKLGKNAIDLASGDNDLVLVLLLLS